MTRNPEKDKVLDAWIEFLFLLQKIMQVLNVHGIQIFKHNNFMHLYLLEMIFP